MLTVNNSFERYSNPPPPASRFSFIVVNHVFSRAEVRTKLYNKFSYRWYLDNGIESKVGPIETPSMYGVYVRGGEGKVKSREGGAALGASIRLDSDLSLVYSFRGRNVLVLREPPPRYECSCIIYVPAVHGSRGEEEEEGSLSHVAYTDHVNASRGIVVFYGETRDPTFLHSDSCISPDKRRLPLFRRGSYSLRGWKLGTSNWILLSFVIGRFFHSSLIPSRE